MSTTPIHDYPPYTKQPFISKQHGFTIVELLIVIVVIAILAAISVVAYNGIQNRANDATVQNDIASAGKNLELYFIDHNAYPLNNADLFAILGQVNVLSYAKHANTLTYCSDNTSNRVAIGGVSASGKGFIYKGGSVKGVDGWSQGSLYTLCNDVFDVAVPIGSAGAWRYPSGTWNASVRS